jgi:type II restriction enzyme
MKDLNYYSNTTEKEAFENLLSSLQKSITTWRYFVDWEKVQQNVSNLNTELNILNSILGSSNIEEDFLSICQKYPEVKSSLPILIAVRKKQLKDLPILINPGQLEILDIKELFEKGNKDYDNLLKFFKESGLKEVFQDKKIKNLVDYVTGIEVGMDTNGRKNRTGTLMEALVEEEIKNICIKNNYEYGTQMTAQKIKERWGRNVPTDKARRRFDFVVNTGEELILFEVNFYRGGGSKLKATAGEYIGLEEILKGSNLKFVWITDGLGWLTASTYLEEAFIKNDYIFTLKMINDGVLEEVL